MTVTLGKRKRREYGATSDVDHGLRQASYHDDHLQNVLRQHFETRFDPLESSSPVPREETVHIEEVDTDEYDTDWTGFSEEEKAVNALVVDYQNLEKSRANTSKEDSKLFMSAKPPLYSRERPSTTKREELEHADPEEIAADAVNLKKDLALQRLLEESHLLDPTSSLTPSGQKRHKALDIRQQALGSKSSMFFQKNMPLAQRRGIFAKATERDDNRRREAKENGIVLERAVKSKRRDLKRQREIGAPAVGKFTRGMLALSKKDVSAIVGQPKKTKRK
ncbi:MAG: hypothetical protein Q9225_004127 [Loekoesia sp. 1 TL-2023]